MLTRIHRLKTEGIVRTIGPVLDPRSLGYQTTLVAARVAQSRLEPAARAISEHPGVSHAYERDHSFNLWFTLALPSQVDIQGELQRLDRLIDAEAIFDLPATRVFKIRAFFDVEGAGELPSGADTGRGWSAQEVSHLSLADRALINEVQQDLPLVKRPFDATAARLNMDISEFLEGLRSLQQRGIMRRFGAAIRHNRVGFVANAMACWAAPPDRVEVAGQKLAALREVSHCYERKTHLLWRFNLFAMIHGRTRESCQSVADEVSRETGLEDRVLLFSLREFKKSRVKYIV